MTERYVSDIKGDNNTKEAIRRLVFGRASQTESHDVVGARWSARLTLGRVDLSNREPDASDRGTL